MALALDPTPALHTWSLFRTMGRFVAPGSAPSGGLTENASADGLALLERPGQLAAHGFGIGETTHALSHEGKRYFGVLQILRPDDGPGADLSQVRASNGLGIRTVERRLQLEYGARGVLRIETAPGAGFLATMSIPLESH